MKDFIKAVNKIKKECNYETEGEALEHMLNILDGEPGQDWRVQDLDETGKGFIDAAKNEGW